MFIPSCTHDTETNTEHDFWLYDYLLPTSDQLYFVECLLQVYEHCDGAWVGFCCPARMVPIPTSLLTLCTPLLLLLLLVHPFHWVFFVPTFHETCTDPLPPPDLLCQCAFGLSLSTVFGNRKQHDTTCCCGPMTSTTCKKPATFWHACLTHVQRHFWVNRRLCLFPSSSCGSWLLVSSLAQGSATILLLTTSMLPPEGLGGLLAPLDQLATSLYILHFSSQLSASGVHPCSTL